jgi:hypothetical protein
LGQAAADEALQLDRRWMELIERPGIDGPLGMFGAMHTLDALACELAGNQRPRAATDLVTNATKLPDPAAPGPQGHSWSGSTRRSTLTRAARPCS